MPPSPGEESPPTEHPKNTSGFASVFKGLAGATKLTKAAPTPLQTSSLSVRAPTSDPRDASPTAIRGLPPNHMEAFEQLKSGSTNARVGAAQQLRHAVLDYPLNPVLDIWNAATDLIDANNSETTRFAGWELLQECVKHPSSTDIERKEYFQTITAPAHPEDFHRQLAALVDLCNHGRDLSGFEYDVFPLLTKWLHTTFASVREARVAARKQGSRGKGKAVVVGEDQDFANLFAFVVDVIKFNFSVADDEAVEVLIDTLLDICMNTSVAEDLRLCIAVLEAIVTFGAIPCAKLKSCVQTLSSIHCLVPSLQKDAWHTLRILCCSHHGQATVRILLAVLSNLPSDADRRKDTIREIRGAISVLLRLVSKSSEKGYPSVPYAVLVDGLAKVVNLTSTWKINLDIMRLVNVLFCDSGGSLNDMLRDEDWAPIFDVIVHFMGVTSSDSAYDKANSGTQLAKDESEPGENILQKELLKLILRLQELLSAESSSPHQRHDCIVFFTKIHRALPDFVALLVLDYFQEFRCCFPSDPDWELHLQLVLDAMFLDRRRSTELRQQALRVITDVYDMVELVDEKMDPTFVPELLRRTLANVSEENDIQVLRDVVTFAAGVASTAQLPLFDFIVAAFRGVIMNGRLRSPISPLGARYLESSTPLESVQAVEKQSPSNIVARGYIDIFLKVLNVDATKAAKLFHSLTSIAKSNHAETDARLTAMRLLFCLRADWAYRIFVTPYSESVSSAALLCRTESSASRKQVETASQPSRISRGDLGTPARLSRRVSFGQGQAHERAHPARLASGSKAAAVRYQPMWTADDQEFYFESTLPSASSVFVTHIPEVPHEESSHAGRKTVLHIGTWLDILLHIFHQGCEWEVYSFVLAHLPAQLSNHAILKEAVPQLQELRRTLCEQIGTNSFQEPPSATGLRRADVAICLFHILTMILSYHEHFQKAEEDEIVRTFVHGITTWERSAKRCIHALSICLHELPVSTSKALVTILQKMAQIITQPHVAMHILEFLACLSRLPSLYINFREEEYRTVFAICFRYLQYVREKSQTHRVGAASAAPPANPAASSGLPNASDDLPQYVYALAYHVITFWFLALKLPDRANQVGWITRNLLTDVDGSQVLDEQAQVTIDFMQRVAYADVDESAPDPLFTPERFGAILSKRWLIGNSIVTIEQATATGWAQITKRQPSGTSSYSIRQTFRSPPAHQESGLNDSNREGHAASTASVLPNHLLVQLLSSMPHPHDHARPIPLPDDEGVDRTIRLFDNNFTVDGHKVGVVYVGENQTKEADILANVSGSSDYVEFLNGLGTLTKLKGATFNTQGLDRQNDADGEYTFCWRDRVTEIVFHVTTQMPTDLEHDPNCTLKKRHVGNDFVNIIFNDSGLPFKFDTFPSDFNYVNIVITPESRASFVASRERTSAEPGGSFYKVQVMSRPGFPEISPAALEKMVSLAALPEFIRLLALNASVFCLVWSQRGGGENVSSWRNRLREIKRLRERYGGPKVTPQGPAPSPPGTALSGSTANNASLQVDTSRPGSTVRNSFSSLRRSSVATFFSTSEQNSHRSSVLSTATTENADAVPNGLDLLVDSLDFSKWA